MHSSLSVPRGGRGGWQGCQRLRGGTLLQRLLWEGVQGLVGRARPAGHAAQALLGQQAAGHLARKGCHGLRQECAQRSVLHMHKLAMSLACTNDQAGMHPARHSTQLYKHSALHARPRRCCSMTGASRYRPHADRAASNCHCMLRGPRQHQHFLCTELSLMVMGSMRSFF